jgi:hypothetical protein
MRRQDNGIIRLVQPLSGQSIVTIVCKLALHRRRAAQAGSSHRSGSDHVINKMCKCFPNHPASAIDVAAGSARMLALSVIVPAARRRGGDALSLPGGDANLALAWFYHR